MFEFPLDVIEDAADGMAEDIRANGYSGRGMFGQTCASITFETLAEAFGFFARLAEAAVEGGDVDTVGNVHKLVAAAATDSMGRSIVVYFPRWTFC